MLNSLIDHFIWTLQCEKRISKNTIQSYTYDMRIFNRFSAQFNFSLTDFNLVQEFYIYLKSEGKLLSTIIRKINLLISFLKFCKEEKGLKIQVPDKNKIKLDKTYRPFLENEDLKKLRLFLKGNDKKNIRLRFIIEVLYSTGMRVTELLSLNIINLNEIYLKKSLVIKGKGDVQRIIFFNNNAIEAIKEYIEMYLPKNKVLNITRQRVFQLLKGLAIEVGIDPSLLFPHTFRHRLLTNLLKDGMDLVSVQRIAGHKQISTTEKYTHVEEYLYDEVLKHHPLKLE